MMEHLVQIPLYGAEPVLQTILAIETCRDGGRAHPA